MAAALMPETPDYWMFEHNGHVYATHLTEGGLYRDGQLLLDGESFWVSTPSGLRRLVERFYPR